MDALTMDVVRGVPVPGASQVLLLEVGHRPRPRDQWLRLFAQGGPADTAPGSGWLARQADAVSRPQVLARATSDEVLGIGRAWKALEGWTFARKLAVVRELIRRHPKDERWDPDEAAGLPGEWEPSLHHEVAAALAISTVAAGRLVRLAWTLDTRLRGVGQALEDNRLDPARVKLIADETSVLEDEALFPKAEAIILDGLPGCTTWGALQRLAQRAVIMVDPDGARRRRERAEREHARVRFWREACGTCALQATGLPTDEALAANANIEARARAYKNAAITRPMDILRVMAYLDLLNGVTVAQRAAWAQADDAARQAEEADQQARERARNAAAGRTGQDPEAGDGPDTGSPDGSSNSDPEAGDDPDTGSPDGSSNSGPDGDDPDTGGPDGSSDSGPDDDGPVGPDGGGPAGPDDAAPGGGPDGGGQRGADPNGTGPDGDRPDSDGSGPGRGGPGRPDGGTPDHDGPADGPGTGPEDHGPNWPDGESRGGPGGAPDRGIPEGRNDSYPGAWPGCRGGLDRQGGRESGGDDHDSPKSGDGGCPGDRPGNGVGPGDDVNGGPPPEDLGNGHGDSAPDGPPCQQCGGAGGGTGLPIRASLTIPAGALDWLTGRPAGDAGTTGMTARGPTGTGAGGGGPGQRHHGGPGPCLACGSQGSASLPAREHLVFPLLTLTGLADRPGEAHGLGALDPGLVRGLATTGARHPGSQFCLTVSAP